MGKIEILKVVFETTWSLHGVSDRCTFVESAKRIRRKVLMHNAYDGQILTAKMRTQLAPEASCLECLFYSIVVSREKLKSGAGPAAERDLRGPIKSLNCPSSRGPRQTNHGITSPVPRY